eukprot:gene2444-8768_t
MSAPCLLTGSSGYLLMTGYWLNAGALPPLSVDGSSRDRTPPGELRLHPLSDGGCINRTHFGEQCQHPVSEGGGRLRTPPGELRLHPVSADGNARLVRRKSSMGVTMVETSQVSSNRFPSSRDRRQVLMENSSSSPLVSPKPAWLRTAVLTPRLQNSRVGRLLELQMQSSPSSLRATRPYGASQSFRLTSSSHSFPQSRRSVPPPYEEEPPSVPLSCSFHVTETGSQDLRKSRSARLMAKPCPASFG